MMKRPIFFLLTLLCSFQLAAQERMKVAGSVKTKGFPLENVHIRNISSKNFTISSSSGKFILNIAAGDTLLLTHVGMQDLIKLVSKEELERQPLLLEMLQKPEVLREVVVNEYPEINPVALGIIPKEIKKLSMNERRLRTAGDFKPIHLLGLLGGSLQVDPILNAINGRTKRLKRYIGIEKKQNNIAILEMNAMTYMIKDMQLTKAQAQLLIDFVVNDERLQDVLDLENQARLEFFLQDAWYRLQNEN